MPSAREAAKNLNEQRIRAMNEANAILDGAIADNRSVTAEERQKIDRLDAKANELQQRVAAITGKEQMLEASAIARGAFERQHGGGATAAEADEADHIRRFLRGDPEAGEPDPENMSKRVLRIPVGTYARERNLIRQGMDPFEARSLLWDTGSVGSSVPTLMARTLYEYMEASLAMWRAPTTKIDTDSGAPMQFPRLAAHGIGTQVIAQGTAIGGTDPTLDRTTFDAYKYGSLVQVASEVIQDSGINILEFLGRDMGRSLGRIVDADLVVGTGTGEPRGLMVALASAGSVTSGGSLIDPTYEKLVDMAYAVNDEYRQRNSAGWLLRDSTAAVVRKIRDGAGGTVGAAMWQPSLTQGIAGGEPDRLLGYPVYTDPNVASLASNARVMAFGDFSAYFVRHVGDVLLERSDDFAFDRDLVTLRAKWRVDGDLMDTNAMVSMVRNV
jgi:HK97 family phage major capsid protein